MKCVEFVCLCNKGYLRKTNQDNFLVDRHFLVADNDGLKEELSGLLKVNNNPLFAVFDGMGGACCGEKAAYISAETLYELDTENKLNSANQIDEAFLIMNSNVCRYMQENRVSAMGSTCSMILFGNGEFSAHNLGDSPIFKFSNGRLTKLSVDHVASECGSGQKPGLTQYLGVPEEEFVIEPYSKKDTFSIGDRFLICSDGLTDMVSNFEIGNILKTDNIKTSAQKLMETALENGGKDNITVVLCEIREEGAE